METQDLADFEVLQALGYLNAEFLASGMEGNVYRVEPGVVAKLWTTDGGHNDPGLAAVFEALEAAKLPFATPAPLGRTTADGRHITLERELVGEILDSRYEPSSAAGAEIAGRVLVEIVTSLRKVSPPTIDYRLLGRTDTVFDYSEGWTTNLSTLIRARTDAFHQQLAGDVDHLDGLLDALSDFLLARAGIAPVLIHGDLCGANVLVGEDATVASVLDWGFLTMPAESTFDAAIAAAVLDMYGPHARETERLLTDMMVESGYERDALAAFKGVYAAITSNIYDPAGMDGHYAWCVRMLNREDVREAVGFRTPAKD